MTGKPKKKIFFPKTRFAELVARAGGIARDDALERAMASMESMREESDTEICRSIATLVSITSQSGTGNVLSDPQLDAIIRSGDQIVTLAGTFGYAALDTAARSLCDIVDWFARAGIRDKRPVAVLFRRCAFWRRAARRFLPIRWQICSANSQRLRNTSTSVPSVHRKLQIKFSILHNVSLRSSIFLRSISFTTASSPRRRKNAVSVQPVVRG
jgi:hypothetical protein